MLIIIVSTSGVAVVPATRNLSLSMVFAVLLSYVTGGKAGGWCLLIHADAFLSYSLTPRHPKGGWAKAWCLFIHAEASNSHSILN